jgi:DNA replication initiation complex subunit (GINS family)
MMTYNDLYEILRKEKYSETLQQLPKNFIIELSEFLNDKKLESSKENDLYSDSLLKSKKQLENAIALFKELILRRKKKMLNLVFVAAETGIMKRDYDNMLIFEKDIFDKLVKAFEDGDKQLSRTMSEGYQEIKDQNRMIIFKQDVEPFVDMSGKTVGPFSSGNLVNLDSKTSEILVEGGKAQFIDES